MGDDVQEQMSNMEIRQKSECSAKCCSRAAQQLEQIFCKQLIGRQQERATSQLTRKVPR